MDSDFMNATADGLASEVLEVVRFEFDYMALTRDDGKRRRPDRGDKLMAQFKAVIDEVRNNRALVIGGKSMGGRIASMVADEVQAHRLICLGYPFHPPGKPERLRTAHLEDLATKTLVVQGERDPFGTRDETGQYPLSKAIRFEWLGDGDHSFKPRKKSGRTLEQNMQQAIEAIREFV